VPTPTLLDERGRADGGAAGVLANDTDPTAQPLTAVLVTGRRTAR
jgi:hypothetical protein